MVNTFKALTAEQKATIKASVQSIINKFLPTEVKETFNKS